LGKLFNSNVFSGAEVWGQSVSSGASGYDPYDFFTNDKEFRRYLEQMGAHKSYAGVDIKAVVTVEPYTFYDREGNTIEATTKVLANLHTISISAFRESYPVRALGQVGIKGLTKGPRTISGSMIFTTFDNQALTELMESEELFTKAGTVGANIIDRDIFDDTRIDPSHILIDQLPPFDITLVMANEYGNVSRAALYGVQVQTQGEVLSVQDLISELSVTYSARAYEPRKSLYHIFTALTNGGQNDTKIKGLARTFYYYQRQFEEGIITMDMYLSLVSSLNAQVEQMVQAITAEGRGKTYNDLIDSEEALKMLETSQNPFF